MLSEPWLSLSFKHKKKPLVITQTSASNMPQRWGTHYYYNFAPQSVSQREVLLAVLQGLLKSLLPLPPILIAFTGDGGGQETCSGSRDQTKAEQSLKCSSGL
jgi:hypothetical protein